MRLSILIICSAASVDGTSGSFIRSHYSRPSQEAREVAQSELEFKEAIKSLENCLATNEASQDMGAQEIDEGSSLLDHCEKWRDLMGFFVRAESESMTHAPTQPQMRQSRFGTLGNINSQRPRVFELKIGEWTGVRGWKGHTFFRSMTQPWVDWKSNSYYEAFRLESVENEPQSLTSAMETVTDSLLYQQRLNGNDLFTFLLDVSAFINTHPLHQPWGPMDRHYPARRLDAADWQAKVLDNLVDQLKKLLNALEKVPPQMWIGSSVALIVDPPGEGFGVAVKLLCWNTSTLSIDGISGLDRMKKTEVELYWNSYLTGIRNLLKFARNSQGYRFLNTNQVELKLELVSLKSDGTEHLEALQSLSLIIDHERETWKPVEHTKTSKLRFKIQPIVHNGAVVCAVSIDLFQIDFGTQKRNLYAKVSVGAELCRSQVQRNKEHVILQNPFQCVFIVRPPIDLK